MAAKKLSEFTTIIRSLKQSGRESEVETRFVVPLIQHLGYNGEDFKDKVSLKGTGEADFVCYVDQIPNLVIEAKSNTVNLSDPSAKTYLEAKFQLFAYMRSDGLIEVPYGLLINGKNAQVFQRKKKVIFPLTEILDLEINTDKTISLLKKILKKPSSYENRKTPLIVSIYNNKGGVGKTVTTGNFAGVFSEKRQNVLLIDLDPQQRDLTDSFKLEIKKTETPTSIFDILLGKELKGGINTIRIRKNLHIIKGDERFDSSLHATKAITETMIKKFRKLLEMFGTKGNFDYILIDCPTNWSFFSKIGVSVSDAVLIPVNYQAAQAIHNAVQVLDKFIPEVWLERKGNGPEVLPILFNNAYTDPTSKKHFDNVRKDEIRKLTKDKWYAHLFDEAIEIKHHHEIATSLFLHMDQNGPSPYTLKNKQTKIFKEYEEILETIFGS
ncbi:MAG: AAA family ATPase [Leptospira sp.]|nr:AAA family ATPase [Leptospira sp.]